MSRGTTWALLLPAIGLGLALGAMELAGWRAHTSIISGTIPAEPQQTLYGLIYAGTWFAAVTLAPILAGGAALSALVLRVGSGRRARG